MAINSYIALAARDLKDAKLLAQGESYSQVGRFCEQVVEKTMKHLIEQLGNLEHRGVLGTHNLTKMYDILVQEDIIPKNITDKAYMATLKSYYYDVNYPGKDFIELDKEDATYALDFARQFFETYQDYSPLIDS